MGTVHALARGESATVGEASDAYLATLAGPESAGTRRVYSGVLRALAEDLGTDTDVATLQPRAVAAWFTSWWGERSPAGGTPRSTRCGAPPGTRAIRVGPGKTRPGSCDAAARPRTAPVPCPAPTSNGCSPAMTSRSASGPYGACCTRPPRVRPRS
jgi:hypothetical protein